MANTDKFEEIVDAIYDLLAGMEPGIQGAVLANLLAIWLAGHFAGPAEITTRLREELLASHLKEVRALIEPNERIILAQNKARAS